MVKRILKKMSAFACATVLLVGGFTTMSPLEVSAEVTSEAYTWQNVTTGTGGGFVPGIIFNTTEENLIYARTDIGGAYRWDEDSQSWNCLTDSVGYVDWNKNGVDALATDPVDTNRVYMAVGTYTNDWDTEGYIMRSSDKGETWEATQLTFNVGGNMPGRSMGERLMVDPNDNSIIYFGARSGNGLWKSTDYGVTWNQVTSFTAVGTYIPYPGEEYGGDATGIAWITFDESTSSSGEPTQTIYVGVADEDECVYVSNDAGETWSTVSGQPTGYLPHHGVLSSTGELYISYSDGVGPYDGTKGEVWKYNTSTGVWTDISPVDSDSDDDYFGYGGLAVDAQNPDTIMVATLNSWWPDANIYRSTDGGETWTQIWDWYGYPTRTFRYTQDITDAPWLTFNLDSTLPEVDPKLGWMIGDLEIDPFDSDRMMYGTGATIYGTDDLTNWDDDETISIEVKGQGMEETAVLDLISPPSGAHLLSGLGDIGGFLHEDLDQAPDAMYSNPTFTSTTSIDYAELSPLSMVRVGNVDDANAIAFSSDGGNNWSEASSQPDDVESGGIVAISADASTTVWSPNGTDAVYYSTDSGSSWTSCSGIPAESSIASDRVNPDKFYGFYDGDFYISTDGGVTFAETGASGLPTASSIMYSSPEDIATNFKALPGTEGDIWFVGGDEDGDYGMWHSTDSGSSFTKLSNVDEADVIGFGKAADDSDYMTLYTSAKIDGTRGIFRSTDEGESWVRINDDDHQYARTNMCITGDPRIYGRVYLGTNGRGIIYGDTTLDQGEDSGEGEDSGGEDSGGEDSGGESETSASLEISAYNGNLDATTVSISPRIEITNTGDEDLDLSDVTIHYYFTMDDASSQNFWCDWSDVGSDYVTGEFVTMTETTSDADCYLEIGFAEAAGELAVGDSVYIQGRIAKSDWSNYTQTDDYSFNATATNYESTDTMTVYVDGSLVDGVEP